MIVFTVIGVWFTASVGVLALWSLAKWTVQR